MSASKELNFSNVLSLTSRPTSGILAGIPMRKQAITIFWMHLVLAFGLSIRTLPNNENKKTRNYNFENHPFLSNEAIYFLKESGVKHIIIDTPSIDKFNDEGKLGNHKIFFTNEDKSINKNTITELVFIPDLCLDGKYFLCIGAPNFKLDATPSKLIIYKVK